MGDVSGRIDVDELMSYSDDLVGLLKDKKDINNWSFCTEQLHSLQSFSNSEFDEVNTLLQDYQKKIDEYTLKIDKAELEIPSDAEMDQLEKELQAELEKERALADELRVIQNEISELDRQKISAEEQKKSRRKLEQDEVRAQRMLSMYASVTNVIPDLDDQSKISGHIVNRDKKKVESFEFDSTHTTDFDTCNEIWKMITQR